MPAAGSAVYGDAVPTVTSRYERFVAWFRALNPWVLDAVLGGAFTVVGLVSLFSGSDPKVDYRDADALGVLLSLGCTLPFFFRRHAPFTTALITTAAVTLMLLVGYPSSSQTQMVLVAAYTLASHGEGVRRVLGFGAIEVGVGTVAVVGTPGASTSEIVLAGAFYAAAYFFGAAMRNRRLYLEQVDERAVMVEREHEEAAKRALADERLRIAQELHDVVAHSMGVIAVQAGVGAHVIDTDPAEAKKSLDAISTTSRTALTEIRRLLGVLRADEEGGYEPAPGLADLNRLVVDLDGAGLAVDVRIEGARHDLPPGVDLTAYRIVQEALTNVLKHAGPATAIVTVGYEPDAVSVEVVDDGRGVNGRASSGGHGLVGMRERVAVYGGTLETGPRVGGGFRVTARLPYGADG
jgi:signal transduction histidine kinase